MLLSSKIKRDGVNSNRLHFRRNPSYHFRSLTTSAKRTVPSGSLVWRPEAGRFQVRLVRLGQRELNLAKDAPRRPQEAETLTTAYQLPLTLMTPFRIHALECWAPRCPRCNTFEAKLFHSSPRKIFFFLENYA